MDPRERGRQIRATLGHDAFMFELIDKRWVESNGANRRRDKVKIDDPPSTLLRGRRSSLLVSRSPNGTVQAMRFDMHTACQGFGTARDAAVKGTVGADSSRSGCPVRPASGWTGCRWERRSGRLEPFPRGQILARAACSARRGAIVPQRIRHQYLKCRRPKKSWRGLLWLRAHRVINSHPATAPAVKPRTTQRCAPM